MVTSIATLLVCAVQQVEPSKPDRSGEAYLKEVFKDMGARRNLSCTVVRYEREHWDDVVAEQSWHELSLKEPGVFRVQYTDCGGDGYRMTCDGKTLVKDSLGDSVTLADKPSGFMLFANEFNFSVPNLFKLFDGEQALEKIVSKSDPIVVTDVGQGQRVVTFNGVQIGESRLTIREENGAKLVVRWDVDTSKSAASSGQQFFFRGMPLLSEVAIKWQTVKSFRKGTFDTTPPAGVTVIDNRKSKSSLQR